MQVIGCLIALFRELASKGGLEPTTPVLPMTCTVPIASGGLVCGSGHAPKKRPVHGGHMDYG